MEAILGAAQDIVAAEPDTGPQPGTAQPDDAVIETQLAQEISTLWSDHVRLSTDRRATSKELRLIRMKLAERLHAMKSLLCRPDRGRASQWQGWLRQQGIPRSTADRLVARCDETLCNHSESMPSEEPSEPGPPTVEELAKSVWQRVGKFLSTGELVVRFIGCIAEISGVGHEQRAEGLVIFNPVPKAADEVPASAPAAEPAPQPPQGGDAVPAETSAAEPAPQLSCETATANERPAAEAAATPTETGQAPAVADAGSEIVQ
jgi:hypothetical protein